MTISTDTTAEARGRTVTTGAPVTLDRVVVTAPPARAPGVLGRARNEGVTGPAVAGVSAALVAVGAAIDLKAGATVGAGVWVGVLLAALVGPAVVRLRSLATAAVLPPLLLAGAASGIARLSGENRGLREVGLDVGTTLALSAPLLFAATAAALVVVLVRVGRHLAARREKDSGRVVIRSRQAPRRP